MQKTIVITGATGLIGKKIIELLTRRGDNVIAVTRNSQKAGAVINAGCRFAEWDFKTSADHLIPILSGVDAVVHLAGENVLSKRWSAAHKQNIYNSRVNTTKILSDAIIKAGIKPKVFISASATGYYGLASDLPVNEDSKNGTDFLALLTRDWENSSSELDNCGIRRVKIRSGIVLSRNEGALAKMITPFKFFIGGPLGTGKQFFPWVHIDDAAGLFIHAIDTASMAGAYNAVAPETITMKDFCRRLGRQMERPSIFNVPSFALKLLYGEGAAILLTGLNVIPKRTLESGYKFSFTDSGTALENLL